MSATARATNHEALVDADPALSPRQRRVLMDVYDGLVATGPARPPTAPSTASEEGSAG